MKKLLIILALLSPLTASAQSVRGLFRVGAGAVVTPPPSNTITVQVTFTGPPINPTATPTVYKYNKQACFSAEIDDNGNQINDVRKYFTGGTASDGVTYPGKTFTDGCGNLVYYRAGSALNARSNFNNGDLWGIAGKLSITDVGLLIDNDFSLLNHSFYHEPTGNFFIPATATYSQAGGGLVQNEAFMWNKLATIGKQYRFRGAIIPSANPGYVTASDSLNYLGISTTGARDSYTGYPTNTALATGNNGLNFINEESLPTTSTKFGSTKFQHQYLRSFFEDWTLTSNLTTMKAQFDDLLAKSSSTKHLGWRFLTHGSQTPVLAGLKAVMEHVDSVATDRLWVVGFHEYLEYKEIKRDVIKSQSLAGNILTLTLDYANVSDLNRYRDMSLIVSGGTIQSVSVVGADSYSVNPATGLLNIFQKKTTGFTSPTP